MAAEYFATLNGTRVRRVHVCVGNTGPWFADVDLDSDTPLSLEPMSSTLRLGTLEMRGTVAPQFDGAFGEQRRTRIVAGAGGWAAIVEPKPYHNDAGVKAQLVAEDAAREVGETLGGFVPAIERMGFDYARQAAVAARTLEDAAGPDVAWWVDFGGVTHVGPRPSSAAGDDAYTLLAYDPRSRIATLSVDDPAAVGIGSIISEGLGDARAVRQLDIRVDAGELRLIAWLGGSTVEPDRLVGILRAIARRATDGRLYGVYRYRVVRQAGERVELQAVRRGAGLPDLGPVSMWPGLAGLYTDLTPGAEVLVSFVEGDRSQPIVTGFAGPGGQGFVPVHITLGGVAGAPAARVGDAVETLLPPATFSGQLNGAPISGVLTWPNTKALGTITAGSSKVSIAT